MKKIILCGTVLAALLTMSTLASAAEPTLVAHHGGRGHGCRNQQTQTCQNGTQCSAFYDENDDGICDHLSSGGHHRRNGTWTA